MLQLFSLSSGISQAFWGQLASWDGKTRICMSLESSMAVGERSSLFSLWTGMENAESSVSGLIARRCCSAEIGQSPEHRLSLLCALELWDTPDPPQWKAGLLVSSSCGKGGEREAFRTINGRWLNQGTGDGACSFVCIWRLEGLSINSCHGYIYCKVLGLIAHEELSSIVGLTSYTC